METQSKVGFDNTRKKQKVFGKCACAGYPVSFVVVLDRVAKILFCPLIILDGEKNTIGTVFVKSDLSGSHSFQIICKSAIKSCYFFKLRLLSITGGKSHTLSSKIFFYSIVSF